MGDKTRGLYHKFNITRTDGQSEEGRKHHDCDYFVLDLDHDKHAIKAILAYADSCREEYPDLSIDLLAKAANKGKGEMMETCSICGRGPHAHDDPECIAGAREIYRDAARYRWWREYIDIIEQDGDGIAGVAYCYQVPIFGIDPSVTVEQTSGDLMDAIADMALRHET